MRMLLAGAPRGARIAGNGQRDAERREGLVRSASGRAAVARLGLVVLLTFSSISCARSPGLFSEQNARAHVNMLAGTIGSRPVGTPANQRAREYIVSQLALFGLDVRVQETDARRPELGRTARVANI